MIGSARMLAVQSWSSFRGIAGDRDIRRVEVAWASYIASHYALGIALIVVAYGAGGALAVAALGVVQMLPSVVLVPLVTGLGDRFPRQRVLAITYAAAAIGALGLAVVLALAPGLGPVFVLAGVVATLGALVRPVHTALLPSLAQSPGQLCAANAASGSAEGLGALGGPALGTAILIVGGPVSVAALAGIGFAVATLSVAGVRTAPPIPSVDASSTPPRGLLRAASEGLRALARLPAPRLVVLGFGAQTFVRGMLTVLLVVAAVSPLGLGAAGVGTLHAAIGAGGLIGAMLAPGIVGRGRLPPAFALGLVGWGLPILLIGLWPQALVAVVLLATLGVSNAVLDVAGYTLLQGTVPDRVRAGVLGAMEGLIGLTVAVGGVTASALVGIVGIQAALVVTGAVLPVLALLLWTRVSRLEDHLIVPQARSELLRGVPMFAPLSLAVVEQLAGGLTERRYPAGAQIIREGESGDAFFLVAEGTAEVTERAQHRADLGPGGSFGEIALIRDVPRTASVRAKSDVRVYRLGRAPFLAAVTGNPVSISAAESVVEARTARPPE